MAKLRNFWEETYKNDQKIFDQDIRFISNNKILKKIRKVSEFIDKVETVETEFLPMETFSEDDDLTVFYKQFEVLELVFNPERIEELANFFIIPSTTYEVIYEDNGVENDFGFYSTGTELRYVPFYEIKDDTMILKVAVYIENKFQNEDFFPPNIKLVTFFRNKKYTTN